MSPIKRFYFFRCKNRYCEWPNLLPVDSFRQPFRSRADEVCEYPPFAFACPDCMHVRIYCPDPVSHYYREADLVVEFGQSSKQSRDVTFLALLQSCTVGCKLHIPVFVSCDVASDGRLNELNWKELRCPNDHSIRFPQTVDHFRQLSRW